MTQGRDGFSLAHRAALMIVAVATAVVMASTGYALDDSVMVTNQGGLLAGTIAQFNANGKPGKNIKPAGVISGGTVPVTLAPGVVVTLPISDVLTGVRVNPTNGPGVPNATYVLSNLEVIAPGSPDIMGFFAQGVFGNATSALGGTFTFADASTTPPTPIVQLALPQDIAFATQAFSTGPVGTNVAIGDLYVTNYAGGETGSVIHFPANVGTVANGLGLIPNPFGATPPVIPSLVLEDSVFDATTNPFGCVAPATTSLLGPVGVALDSTGDIWVANSGFRGSFPSYITEYAPGSFGCTPAINLIGLGTLVSAGYMAIDSGNDIWVTDLTQNAVFEFSPAGAVLTTIQGKKTGLKSPMGIALGAETIPDVYVANEGGGNILVYEDADDGGLLNLKTTTRIQGKKTKIPQPVGVAVIP